MSIKSDLQKHQKTVNKLAVKQRKLVEDELQHIRRLASLEIMAGTTGKQLKDNLRAATKIFVDKSLTNLMSIAEKESSFIAKRIPGATALTKEQLQSKILNENMRLNLGSQEKVRKSLSTAFTQFGNRKADEIAQIIRDGQTLGLTSIEIMKNVDERINGLHTSQARVLSNTSTLYTSNVAQRDTMSTASKRVVFTLGDSTDHTDICLGLEGQEFEAGDV
jgi:hypothetical protein